MIKIVIQKLFNLIGFNIVLSPKKSKSIIAIDRNVWEPYVSPNRKMQLYLTGLKQSQGELTDTFYKQLRFYSLQQMVYHILRQQLIGDFVECGVWKGHSAYIISSILSENKFVGDFHIFDSFEGGLSCKVERDKNLIYELSEKQIQEESDVFCSTEDEVKSCLSSFCFIHLYKGWILSRFNEVDNKRFSFVHIDVDLYEPIRDSLDFFYPKLVENGVIVCDDYGASQFPGATRAVDEFLQKNSCKMFYEVPMGSCFIIK